MSDCFFFNDTATTEIYTLSLHDALPIFFVFFDQDFRELAHWIERPTSVTQLRAKRRAEIFAAHPELGSPDAPVEDRKSTRLNSSHLVISYAVFCLKKKH